MSSDSKKRERDSERERDRKKKRRKSEHSSESSSKANAIYFDLKPGTFKPPLWAADDPVESLKDVILEEYKEEGVILRRLYLGGKNRKTHQVFGREKGTTDVQLGHESLSRQHAAFIQTDDGFYLCDLFSKHGTWFNDTKLQGGRPEKIVDYDVIRFGGSSRKYKVKGFGMRRSRKPEKESKPSRKEKESGKSKGSKEKSIQCHHILIKHKSVRRPKSHRGEITRSEEEARALIEGYLNDLKTNKSDFAELATKVSDCSSFKRGGDLGPFTHAKMHKSFSDAAFALKVGETSNIVETESGLHIILRIS